MTFLLPPSERDSLLFEAGNIICLLSQGCQAPQGTPGGRRWGSTGAVAFEANDILGFITGSVSQGLLSSLRQLGDLLGAGGPDGTLLSKLVWEMLA